MINKTLRNSEFLIVDDLMTGYLRIIAMFQIVFCIKYWLLITGVFDPEIRFDTLSIYWKIAAPILVIIQPVAALGLWGAFRWGPVVWFMAIVTEIIMYGFYSNYYGEANLLLMFHLGSFAIYLLYKGYEFYKIRSAH